MFNNEMQAEMLEHMVAIGTIETRLLSFFGII